MLCVVFLSLDWSGHGSWCMVYNLPTLQVNEVNRTTCLVQNGSSRSLDGPLRHVASKSCHRAHGVKLFVKNIDSDLAYLT